MLVTDLLYGQSYNINLFHIAKIMCMLYALDHKHVWLYAIQLKTNVM